MKKPFITTVSRRNSVAKRRSEPQLRRGRSSNTGVRSRPKEGFISVIIPTWRESKVLNLCLSSLLAQDYPQDKFEIILVSKENLAIKNKKTKVIKIEKKLNHAEARNIGVSKSQGEIIAFCDDDCILPKNWLSTAADYFIDKKADLIGGPVLPPPKTPFNYRLAGYLAGSRFTVGYAASKFRDVLPEKEANEADLILANTFIKREAFKKFGGFDKDQVPCEENFLYAKLKKNGYKLLYSPKLACVHPAKPIFLPWAKKIYFYATGRGQLIIRAPETFHPQYLVPSSFILFLPFLTALSLFSLLAFSYLLAIILVYSVLSLGNALYIYLKYERSLLIFIVAPIATFVVHVSYGLGFLNGLIRYLLGKREAVKMPSKD